MDEYERGSVMYHQGWEEGVEKPRRRALWLLTSARKHAAADARVDRYGNREYNLQVAEIEAESIIHRRPCGFLQLRLQLCLLARELVRAHLNV